jgi:vacuolar-type H+-ATPase subunit E/Vma4
MQKCSGKIISKVETEIIEGADIIVAGGGTAGVVAAIAAARAGTNVMLIERYGYLGGMITAGNAGLTMYTKYSGNPEEHAKDEKTLETAPEKIQIVGGIPKEITERLLASGTGKGNSGTFGSYVFTSSEDFKRLLFQMMKEAKVKLRLHSLVVDVIQENDCIKGVIVESKSGRQFIPAKQFIDATGDGDLAAKAGVPFTVGVTKDDICASQAKIGEMQPTGVMFKVGNCNLQKTLDWLNENPERFKEHPFARFPFETVKKNFWNGDTATMCIRHEGKNLDDWFQVYNLPLEGVVTLCCPCIKNIDGCNVDDLTRAEIIMADMVQRWIERVSSTVPGFENIFLLDCPQVGIRETRHIQGEYLLNLVDIYEQKDFEDSIGLGSHPIDTRPRPEWLNDPETAYPARWYFKIPFRCLVAKNKTNLLVAGRCISATHEAFGCIRPTVQCMITGEAAGAAAALCVKENVTPKALDIKLLKKTLTDSGVIL